jgi:ABC-type transport system substrate-binding protein
MSTRSLLAAAVCAAAVAAAGAGSAFAGEITGNGKSLEPLHANSICAYSGLNDDPTGIDPNNGPPGRVQSWGKDVKDSVLAGNGPLGGVPGEACRGGSL